MSMVSIHHFVLFLSRCLRKTGSLTIVCILLGYIDVGKTAILAHESSASVTIDNCKLRSAKDTGVWMLGCSKSTIIGTTVNNCGNTGIWCDSSPVILKDVNVSGSKYNGIGV